MIEILRFWPDLSLVFGAFFIAVGSPGPSNMVIMGTSMQQGRTRGLALALGVSLGSISWGLMATAGVAALLSQYPQALWLIKTAGALYMFYLAWRAGRSALGPDPSPGSKPSTSGLGRLILQGMLMHLTNPKAILTWTAIMVLGLRDDMPPIIVIAMLAGCFLISFTLNSLYALVFSSQTMIDGYRRVRKSVDWCLAGFFSLAGWQLLTSR